MDIPIAWTIGGSDSGAGAGIQADIKTMNALGVHGCSAITAITAQNTVMVKKIEPVSSAILESQLETLLNDLPPKAIKFGMLFSSELMQIAAKYAKQSGAFTICDPVIAATTGNALMIEDAIFTMHTHILPACDLLTPNLPEAYRLINGEEPDPNRQISDKAIEDLAQRLLQLGPKSILLKGGHRQSDYCQDYFTDGTTKVWLTSERIEVGNTHGTGCILSSAICAAIAHGFDVLDAIVLAKAYVIQGLSHFQKIGKGSVLLAHLSWPESEQDLPWLTKSAEAGRNRTEFQEDNEIAFYPIVDNADWIEQLSPAKVRTMQLRIKDMHGEELEKEIEKAVQTARKHNCNLYVNDHWELAIKYGAFGVHLGQEDLDTADIEKIQNAGLHLGISTHCYREVARAISIRPSYIAIGPIFPTTTKPMKFPPQGLAALKRWRRSLDYPLVAIGGIFKENAAEILDIGVESISVVREISQSKEPTLRAAEWIKIFQDRNKRTKKLQSGLKDFSVHASIPPVTL
jgi:hydroxymethylpyrimidine kinase/phosphomethylpyrimidine kinase/thiamine-phosphate diphosphorylase